MPTYNIISPPASFIQFQPIPERPCLEQKGFVLQEYLRCNAAFQIGITVDDGPVEATVPIYSGICHIDGTAPIRLKQFSALCLKTYIAFPSDTITLDYIKIGNTYREYVCQIISREELVQFLKDDFDIDATISGTNIIFTECCVTETTISILPEEGPDTLTVTRYYDRLYVDMNYLLHDVLEDIFDCYAYCVIIDEVTVIGKSNNFKRSLEPCFLTLIRYRNNEDAFGFQYQSDDSIYNRISLPFYLSKPAFPVKKNVYRKSNGKNIILSASLDKQLELLSEWMPEFFHECFSVAMIHDVFEIYENTAWKGYVTDQDYKIDWEDKVDSGQATTRLKQQIYNYVNDNCGLDANCCMPPYVEVVPQGDTTIALFQLFPTLKYNHFKIRARAYGDTVWEDFEAELVINPGAITQYTLDLSPWLPYTVEYQWQVLCGPGVWSNWTSSAFIGDIPCVDPYLDEDTSELPDGQVGVFYDHSTRVFGDMPISIASITAKPAWMTITIIGNILRFYGTPDVDDNDIDVKINIDNDCNIIKMGQTISITPAETGGLRNRGITYNLKGNTGLQLLSTWKQGGITIHSGGITAGSSSPFTLLNVLADGTYQVDIVGDASITQAWIRWSGGSRKVLLTAGVGPTQTITTFGNITVEY